MAIAVTRNAELLGEANAIILCARFYASPEEFWFKRLVYAAKKLMQADPVEGHSVMSMLHVLVGDVDASFQEMEIVRHLTSSPLCSLNRAVNYSNLGFFSLAQQEFSVGAAPENGSFLNRIELGFVTGSVSATMEFVNRAALMKLDIDAKTVQKVERSYHLLRKYSVTDKQLGEWLDVAGSLMRENRMFFVGPGPEVIVGDQDDSEEFISFSYKLPVTSKEAAEIDAELGRRLWETKPDLPFEVTIHFESGLPLSERFSERASIPG